MLFSVIIPTCNRNELLSKCLDLLVPGIQTCNGENYEVIVTDDSVKGVAADLIQQYYNWVTWVKGPGKGPALNRNNGAAKAKGDWLVFIDDDCIPTASLLETYSMAIKLYYEVEVFEGYIYADRAKRSFIEESPINETGGFLWSCNFMIKRLFFEQLDGFDSKFPYPAMEDVDLQYRINTLNKKIIFVTTARVMHPWRVEKNIISRTKKRFQSTKYFIKKHPEMQSKINAYYFFKLFAIYLKNAFKYSREFKYRGLRKQLVLSILYLYFALILFIKSV